MKYYKKVSDNVTFYYASLPHKNQDYDTGVRIIRGSFNQYYISNSTFDTEDCILINKEEFDTEYNKAIESFNLLMKVV